MTYYCTSHHCVRGVDGSTISASFTTLYGWWLAQYYCISRHCVLSDNGKILLTKSWNFAELCLTKYYINHHCVGSHAWRNFSASVVPVCGVITDSVSVYQSSHYVEWWLMDDLWISYPCVCSDDWRKISASIIVVCGVMTGALLQHESSLCPEWWTMHHSSTSHHLVRSDD